jgi:hypothetical protein
MNRPKVVAYSNNQGVTERNSKTPRNVEGTPSRMTAVKVAY